MGLNVRYLQKRGADTVEAASRLGVNSLLGVVIHENLELKNGTPGRQPEGASPEPLYLQGHGNPVVYRNIWAVKK